MYIHPSLCNGRIASSYDMTTHWTLPLLYSILPPTHTHTDVTSINEINQISRFFEITGFFRTWWTDPRLSYASRSANGHCYDQIDVPTERWSEMWQPDLYFENSIEEMFGADLLYLYPDGSVWRSQRFTITFECPGMFFGMMPFDVQRCPALISTYSQSGLDLTLSTPDAGSITHADMTALSTPEFSLVRTESELIKITYGVEPNTYPWYTIAATFYLKREAQFIILTVIFPSIFFYIVTYVGFWVDRHLAPARVSSAVLPIIITVTLQNTLYAHIPRISYGTWITDFVFYSLMFSVSGVEGIGEILIGC